MEADAIWNCRSSVREKQRRVEGAYRGGIPHYLFYDLGPTPLCRSLDESLARRRMMSALFYSDDRERIAGIDVDRSNKIHGISPLPGEPFWVLRVRDPHIVVYQPLEVGGRECHLLEFAPYDDDNEPPFHPRYPRRYSFALHWRGRAAPNADPEVLIPQPKGMLAGMDIPPSREKEITNVIRSWFHLS